jgi:hypothetical protein
MLRRFLFTLLTLVLLVIGPRAALAAPPPDPGDAPVSADAVTIPKLPEGFVSEDGGWMKIAYPPQVRDRVAPIVAEANAVRAELADELEQPVLDRVDVRVARTPEEMARLAPEGMPPFSYATAMAYPTLHLVILSLQAPVTSEAPDIDELFRHELTHIALYDAVAGRHVPRWFNEGFAVAASGELAWKRTKTLWDATLSESIMPLSELDAQFPDDPYRVNIAYAESADFVRFLLKSADRARFAGMIERVKAGQAFDRALGDAYGSDERKLEYEWREELKKKYGYLPALTGTSFVWVGVVVLMAAGWVRKKKRDKAKLDQWEREEAALDAAYAAAKRRSLAAAPGDVPEDPVPVKSTPPLPMVEHDGTWHTLH